MAEITDDWPRDPYQRLRLVYVERHHTLDGATPAQFTSGQEPKPTHDPTRTVLIPVYSPTKETPHE